MDSSVDYTVSAGGLGVLFAIYMIFIIAIYVVAVIGLWKMYVKAGKPGWAAIIPGYNWWVWVEIIGRPRWWFWAFLAYILLSWIPIVGFILGIAIIRDCSANRAVHGQFNQLTNLMGLDFR